MNISNQNDNTVKTVRQKRSEESRSQSINYRKRVETILESFTDGFFEVDDQWKISYWNRTAEELLLRPRNEVIGKGLWDCYPEATELKFYTEYHRCMAEQTATRFEEYFAPRDMWFEVSVFPNGQGLSVYFKDISQRKYAEEQLESERQKYRDLFEHNPMPQWVYDSDSLAFLDVNEAAVRHYGYSREEFLSTTLEAIRPAEDIPLLEKYLNGIHQSDSTKTRLVRHQKKNGEIMHAEVKGTTIEFNGRKARLVVVVDKTSEINAENTKRQSVAKLQEISWIQAHEVRRPLSNLLGLAELMTSKNDEDTMAILIERLKQQAMELDLVIRKTTAHLPPENK